MPFIAVLGSVRERATLADSVAGIATVRICERAEELPALRAAPDLIAVVAGLRDARGASTVPALLALGNRPDAVPTVVVVSLATADIRAVMRMIEAGLYVTLVIRDFEDLAIVVERVVADRAEAGPAAVLLHEVAPIVTDPVRSFFVFAAIGGERPVTVHEAANILGVAARTLEGQLRRSGMPPPHRVLGWYRLLHAAWHLDVLGCAPKAVAGRLRFASTSALYNLFQHYVAPTPVAVREQQGFAELLERFTKELSNYSGRTARRG